MDGVFVRSFIRNFCSFSLFSLFFFWFIFYLIFLHLLCLSNVCGQSCVSCALTKFVCISLGQCRQLSGHNESNPFICRSPLVQNEITNIDFTVPTVFISEIAKAKAFSSHALSFNKWNPSNYVSVSELQLKIPHLTDLFSDHSTYIEYGVSSLRNAHPNEAQYPLNDIQLRLQYFQFYYYSHWQRTDHWVACSQVMMLKSVEICHEMVGKGTPKIYHWTSYSRYSMLIFRMIKSWNCTIAYYHQSSTHADQCPIHLRITYNAVMHILVHISNRNVWWTYKYQPPHVTHCHIILLLLKSKSFGQPHQWLKANL